MAGEANVATYGIRIAAPEGTQDTVSAFGQITSASQRATQAVEGHAGSFDKLTGSMVRQSSIATRMLQTLGGLGGGAAELGVRFERAGLQIERLAQNASKTAAGQQALNTAFNAGAISAATMEAATTRLMAARNTAIAIEQAYARAVAATQIAQEEAQIAAMNVREQRVVTSAATGAAVGSGVFSAESDAAAKSQKDLNRVQGEAVVASNALRGAQAEELALKQQLTTANKEAAAAQKLVNDGAVTGGLGFAGTAAIVTALIAVLVVLAVTFYAVKKAWDFFTESIKAAGAEQKAEFPFIQMVANATLAEAKLKEIHDLTNSQGSFDFSQFVKGAEQLIVLNTGADNLVPRLKAMAALAAASGESIDSMTTAYSRTQQAIMNSTELMTRGMNGSRIILLALMMDLGKSQDQVQSMFKKGQISIEMVNKALLDASASGGKFGKTLSDYLKTLPGATEQLANRWEQIKVTFGTPIANSLVTLLTLASDKLIGMIPLAEEAGKRVAGLVDAFAKIAKEDGWKTALKAAWSVLMDEIGLIIHDAISGAFTASGSTIIKGIDFTSDTHTMMEGWRAGFDKAVKDETPPVMGALKGMWNAFVTGDTGKQAADDYTKGAVSKLDQDKATLKQALDNIWKPAPTFGDQLIGGILNRQPFNVTTAGVGAGGLQAGDTPLNQIAKPVKDSDWDKYKTDLAIINDYWQQRDIIESKVTDTTEKERRIMELTTSTAKELYDPSQFEPYLGALGQVAVAEAERERKNKEIDEAIKNGSASATDAILRGLDKAKAAFGNWQQAVEKGVTDIANALSNDISTGLSDIIDGTKSVSQGFTDMALSIIKDIERIIIKMEVEYLLKLLMGGFGVGGGTTVSGGGGAGGGAGMATGGPIYGGSGTKDDVPAMLTGGEYVLSKQDVARAGGTQALDAWKHGTGGATYNQGVAHFTAGGGVQRTNFGPYEGNPNAPHNSLPYLLWRDGYYDSQGNPHQSGDISLSPDQVHGAHYGDTVTRGGVTGRFTDTTNPRLSNRVDVWNQNDPGNSQSSGVHKASDIEWTTSPGDRRFLPGSGMTPEEQAHYNAVMRDAYGGGLPGEMDLNQPGPPMDFQPPTGQAVSPWGLTGGTSTNPFLRETASWVASNADTLWAGNSISGQIGYGIPQGGYDPINLSLPSGSDVYGPYDNTMAGNTSFYDFGANNDYSPQSTETGGIGSGQPDIQAFRDIGNTSLGNIPSSPDFAAHVDYGPTYENNPGRDWFNGTQGTWNNDGSFTANADKPVLGGPSPAAPGGGTSGDAGQSVWSRTGQAGIVNDWSAGSLYTSNMDASTKSFLLGGGYGGNPNRNFVNDEERVFAAQFGARGKFDSSMWANAHPQQGDPTVSTNVGGSDAFNAAIMARETPGQRSMGSTFSGNSFGPVLQGPSNLSHLPKFHAGGIVGMEGGFQYLAGGGSVNQPINAQPGEGVFTQGQMAAIGAGMSGGNSPVSISISVTNNADGSQSARSSASGGGMTKEEWAQAAQMMSNIALQTLQTQKRRGGSLYRSQTGATA
jgi:hypothetical protein